MPYRHAAAVTKPQHHRPLAPPRRLPGHAAPPCSSPGRPRCTITGHARPSWMDQQARGSTTSLLPRAPPCAAAVLIADRPAPLPRSIRATVSIPQAASVVLALVDRSWPLETPERPLAGAFHRADPPPQSPEPLRTPVIPAEAPSALRMSWQCSTAKRHPELTPVALCCPTPMSLGAAPPRETDSRRALRFQRPRTPP